MRQPISPSTAALILLAFATHALAQQDAIVQDFIFNGDSKEKGSADKDALQGTWLAVAGENSREKFDKELKDIRVLFKGEKLTIRFEKEILETTFKLDPGRKPKSLDIT